MKTFIVFFKAETEDGRFLTSTRLEAKDKEDAAKKCLASISYAVEVSAVVYVP